MKVIIYGASDDLVELEGDISDEIDCYTKKPKLYVYYKDTLQFVIKTSYDGVWNITPMLDEKTYYPEIDLKCRDWKITFLYNSKENKYAKRSSILSIDSGDDVFEITKKRRK